MQLVAVWPFTVDRSRRRSSAARWIGIRLSIVQTVLFGQLRYISDERFVINCYRVDTSDAEFVPHLAISQRDVVQHRFKARLPDDVIALNVQGLLHQYDAKILKVSRNRVKIRIGTRYFFPWLRRASDPAFKNILKFDRDKHAATSIVEVRVTMRPLALFFDKSVVEAHSLGFLREVQCWLSVQDTKQRTSKYVYAI